MVDRLCKSSKKSGSDAEDLRRQGARLIRAGNLRLAIECLSHSVAADQRCVSARILLATAYGMANRHYEAEQELRVALAFDSESPDAHCNLGVALEYLERYQEAIEHLQNAIRLKPGSATAWTSLSNALRKAGRPCEGLKAAEEAMRLTEEPLSALPHNAMGTALLQLGRADDALRVFERAASLGSSDPEARVNLAMTRLVLGHWREGFTSLECRFAHPTWRRLLPGERWRVSAAGCDQHVAVPPRGDTVLLYGEGGLGNGIQFVRFVSRLACVGVIVVIECRPELVPLLRTVAGVSAVIGFGQPLPPYSCYAALMSLPALLGIDQANAAANGPYLSAEPARVAKWEEFLRPQRAPINGHTKSLLVGVSWQGEQRPAFRRNRSFPAAMLARLAQVPGVRLVSLQKGCTFDGSFPMIEPPGLDEHGGAFLDTAAIMMHLDLIVTCDTSIAHLAGALARPTWVALPFAADWRWMQKREDTPWYPTMRLFRQTSIGDWDGVFDRIARELSMLRDRPR